MAVGDDRVLAARPRAVDGTRTGFFTPADGADVTRVHDEPFEVDPVRGTEVVNKIWWIWSQTPAACQSRKRFQQVMPQPQPISCGKSSQGMPVLRMKMIPVRTLRSSRKGRPPSG